MVSTIRLKYVLLISIVVQRGDLIIYLYISMCELLHNKTLSFLLNPIKAIYRYRSGICFDSHDSGCHLGIPYSPGSSAPPLLLLTMICALPIV